MFFGKDDIPINDFFITSDTWFGRPHILQIANRSQFSSIQSMNKQFIKKWNSAVKPGDTIFHLGNFAWDPSTAKAILDKLNGNIYFMLGNSDDAILEVEHEFDNVAIIEDQIIELPEFNSVLCHYPIEVWNGKSAGVIHFHGHTVFSHKTDLSLGNRVNVCLDFWNYSPIKYSTIKEFINAKNKK